MPPALTCAMFRFFFLSPSFHYFFFSCPTPNQNPQRQLYQNMSEFRQRGSFEAYHNQLNRINEQRRKKPAPASSSSSTQRTQIFSIEDIPFDGSIDRQVAKPPPPRTSTTRSSTWSTDRTRNDYSQR